MIDPESRTGRALRRVGSQRWARLFLGPRVLTRIDAVAHRATGGRWRLSDLLFDTIQLTTTGRRSGQARPSPLGAYEVDGNLVVIGSNFGREHHPAWSHNLLADPEATVNRHGEDHRVRARLLEGDERERAWQAAVDLWPGYETYRQATEGIRDIRVFALERIDG